MRSIVFFILVSAVICFADKTGDLIANGQLNEAYRLLIDTYKNSTDEPEYLFIRGLTEETGENSVTYLKDFINRSPDKSYLIDWARLYLGKYNLAQKLYVTARKHFEDITTDSPFYAKASYLAAKCFLLTGEIELAADAFGVIVDSLEKHEHISNQDDQTTWYNWAKLGLADALLAMGNYDRAESIYTQLLEPEYENDLSAPALLGMAELSERRQNWTDSQGYLKAYNDRYGSSEGHVPEDATTEAAQESSPENLELPPVSIRGGQYFIQIGVFFNKDNASRLSTLYKDSGYKTHIENFIEGGEEFHRVLVGPYDSKQQTEFIKKRLEKAAKEKYLLIER